MTTLEARITEALTEHYEVRIFGPRCCCGMPLGLGNDERYPKLAAHQSAVVAGIVKEAQAEALREAAEAMDGDGVDSFYITRRRELSHPYSKPMYPEQWGELDGIESAAKWLRARADTINPL